MNLVRSSIVPHTIASETAQKTNSKNHLAAAGAWLPEIAGRSRVEPGLKVGKKPLPPMTAKIPPAPNAKPNPTAQKEMELTLRLVRTLATTVPTFFMRLKPTSSMAKPACMNMTKQAATTTQTVSAATPAWPAVGSSAARAATGVRAASSAVETANRRRFRSSDLGNDVTSRALMPLSVGRASLAQKRADAPNLRRACRGLRTRGLPRQPAPFGVNHRKSRPEFVPKPPDPRP